MMQLEVIIVANGAVTTRVQSACIDLRIFTINVFYFQ